MKNQDFRLLFIQHTTEIGGSLVCLNILYDHLKQHFPSWKMEILCKDRSIHNWYQEHSYPSSYFSWIGFFGHCAGNSYQLHAFWDLVAFFRLLLLFPLQVIFQFFYLKKRNIDLIHLNSTVLVSSAIAAKLAGIPVVWHVREILLPGNWGIRRRLIGTLIEKLSNKIIAISPIEAEQIPASNKVHIIYDPIHLFSNSTFQELTAPDDSFTILSLGGFNRIKGADYLLDAFLYIPASIAKKIKIVILGETEELKLDWNQWGFWKKIRNRKKINFLKHIQASIQKIQHLGFEKNLSILPPQKNVVSFIQNAHVLYFGGTEPHFPRPIFEAWSLKKAVLAFDLLGINHYVKTKENGILAATLDAEELAKEIQWMNEHREEVKKMGEKGFQRAKEVEELSQQTINFEGIFEEFWRRRSDLN